MVQMLFLPSSGCTQPLLLIPVAVPMLACCRSELLGLLECIAHKCIPDPAWKGNLEKDTMFQLLAETACDGSYHTAGNFRGC